MKAATLLALCLAASLAGPAAAAPGDLDRSFGRGGLLHTDIGGTDWATGVTLLPQGRILAWGRSDVSPPFDARMGPGNEDFALARYTPTGSLDPGFGRGGRLLTDMGGPQDAVTAVAVQGDGKLLVAGLSHRYTVPYRLLVLARYDTRGRLDPSFGNGGSVTVQVGDGYTPGPGAVRQLDDGRILMAAGTTPEPLGVGSSHIALLRFLPDGRPDPEFGEGGTRVVPFHGGTGRVARFAADSAGRLVVLGSSAGSPASGQDLVVARYTPAGELDPSFGQGGHAVLSFGNLDYPGALMADRDGGVLLSEQVDVAGSGMRLIRLGPDGRLDPAFGAQGSVDLPFHADRMALDGSGRIVVGGDGLRLARYSRAGVRDARFVEARVPRGFRGHRGDLAVQPDGRVVAVSYMTERTASDPYGPPPDFDFAVARFHGGDDVRPPRIRLAGARPRGCLRRRALLRVRVLESSVLSGFAVRLDGRRLAVRRRGMGYTVAVRVGKLRPGTHRLVVVARDASDNRAVLRTGLRRCR